MSCKYALCQIFYVGLILFLVGCGGGTEGPPRRIVEGTVTFEGKPLQQGIIRFVPQPEGPVAMALITDGKYKVENKSGVPFGKNRVEIVSSADGSQLTQDQLDAGVKLELVKIPEKYNTQSTLEETIIQEEGPQTIDFVLTR